MNTSTNDSGAQCGCSACTCQPCNCAVRIEALPAACTCDEDCGCEGGEQGCLCN